MSDNDVQLLRQYATERSDEAFASLVRRHINLVYSAALRQVRSPDLAEEIVQSVFADLARNASRLKPDTILTAWLYQVTRRTAVDFIRQESRRRNRERIALEMNTLDSNDKPWSQIEGLLEEAMDNLNAKDRNAILLRYFENKSLRDVGETLGMTEDTAQKRVSRAIERLRAFFIKRGVTVSSSAIIAAIGANAVQAAPVGVLASVLAGTAFSGASAGITTIAQTFIMTTAQKTIVTAVTLAIAGAGLYGTRRISRLESELGTLRQHQAPLIAQLRSLQQERDEATNLVASLENQLRRTSSDLPKLRGTIAQLKAEARDAAQSKAVLNDPFVQSAASWKEKEARLRQLMAERPDQRVPELALINERTWLDIARDSDLDSENGVRQALSNLRQVAKNTFAPMMETALRKYIEAHDGQLPQAIGELKPYFDSSIDEAFLRRYDLLYTGKLSDVPNGSWIVREKAAVDPEYDLQWSIGPNGYSTRKFKDAEYINIMEGVLRAYAQANNGTPPKSRSELIPFLRTPEQKAAYKEIMEDAQIGFSSKASR